MSMHFREIAEQAMADGEITAEEILALRREGWADGRMSAEEAEALFVLNDHLKTRSSEWTDTFVEAVVEYLLAGGSPRGYLSASQADWLITRIDHDGQLDSMAELEMLAKLFERAENVPDSLRDYAMRQIEQIVLTGTGPTRDSGRVDANCITDAECRLLRRMIFARGGEGTAGVSRREAEMLFRIKDATLGAANSPEWKRLFVQGVGNYLCALNKFQPLSAERAAQLDAFMADTSSSVGGFFRRMAKADIGEETSRVLGFGRKGLSEPAHADAVAKARAVTDDESAWLQARMDANGVIDELDQAVLDFLKEEEEYRSRQF